MNERLKRIIFKKLDQDLGQAEIIVDDNKSIWFIDRANKFWYLELRSSGTLWWRYSFFRDFFPLFGLERLEYEPVIAEWVEEVLKRGVSSTTERRFGRMEPVEEVLKRGVSSTLRAFGHFGVEEVLKREVSSTEFNDGVQSVGAEKVLKREVFSTLQSKIDYQNQVEEVLKREVSSTLHREFPLMDGGVEEALKRGVSSTQRNHMNDCDEMEEALKRGVSSTQRNHMNDCDEMEEALKRGVYSTQCNVGLQGSRPVEEVLKPKTSPTTVDNLSAVVTMEKVLSLKAGVRECKMKIKKIFKKFTSK
jgi:hypothetical protein